MVMSEHKILEAAAQVIREKGFHAASMQDIAKVVGLKKASLYHHINSKHEILYKLLDQALDLLIGRMDEVIRLQIPPDEKFKLAMAAYLGCMAENLDLSAVLLLEYRSLEQAEMNEHIQKRDHYESLWREIIKNGISEGVFAEVDEKMATKAVLGVANWTIIWLDPMGNLSASEIAEISSDLLLNGFYLRE